MEVGIVRNHVFWILHGIWALCWIGATIYLFLIPKSGDMPASLLTVFSIPAGLVGHGIILLIAYFKRLGDKLVSRRSGDSVPVWPWQMLIIAVVLLVTTGKVVEDLILGGISYNLLAPKYVILMLLKPACLVGLLLRQPWSRWLIIGLFGYWFAEALYVGYRYWILYPGYSLTIYVRPVYYMLLSSSLIVILLRSESVRVFYGKAENSLSVSD
jgi:hypothetical protein